MCGGIKTDSQASRQPGSSVVKASGSRRGPTTFAAGGPGSGGTGEGAGSVGPTAKARSAARSPLKRIMFPHMGESFLKADPF